MDSLTDRLALATTQLQMTDSKIRECGVTADDLTLVAAYLSALTDHGYQVAALALRAVENAATGHPVREVPHGTDVQASLGHAMSLFDAAMHFAGDAEHALRQNDSDR